MVKGASAPFFYALMSDFICIIKYVCRNWHIYI